MLNNQIPTWVFGIWLDSQLIMWKAFKTDILGEYCTARTPCIRHNHPFLWSGIYPHQSNDDINIEDCISTLNILAQEL